MNNAVADLYFLVLVHERLCDVGIMAVPGRRTTNERRPIRNRFLLCRSRKIFARREDWCGCTNCAHRCHVNVLRGNSDKRTSGTGICVDERVGRNFGLVERVDDVGGCIKSAAVRVHVENDCGRFVGLGCFH